MGPRDDIVGVDEGGVPGRNTRNCKDLSIQGICEREGVLKARIPFSGDGTDWNTYLKVPADELPSVTLG